MRFGGACAPGCPPSTAAPRALSPWPAPPRDPWTCSGCQAASRSLHTALISSDGLGVFDVDDEGLGLRGGRVLLSGVGDALDVSVAWAHNRTHVRLWGLKGRPD